jgi:uncharacterized protein
MDPSAPFPRPMTAPNAFSVMTKPTGAICNLDCTYCYFLEKEQLYPGSQFRMDHVTTEIYVKQLLESQNGPECSLVWQGGEPTLMGLDFFKNVMALVEQYKPEKMQVFHSIQTNGTLLDDEWCEFFASNNFLVGISIDGPEKLHDTYRVNKAGKATHAQVLKAINLLKKHKVEFNILTVVNKSNQSHPLDVYRYFRDVLDASYIQFIPLVETRNSTLAERSVDPKAWGEFLITIYDEWLGNDVGKVFVQIFEVALGIWLGKPSSLCLFAEECGNGLALEHNGDLYSCDHFVDPKYLLGNIKEKHILELVASDKQREFGRNKRTTLPNQCLNCEVKFACNGECPKNRIISTSDGEFGLNYLCVGYRNFFNHIDSSMKEMADLLISGKYVDQIMEKYR